jgi:hypothetical protein
MLGVRPATGSGVSSALQADGLIWYTRGIVEVVDRPELEARACECYETMPHEFDQLRNPDRERVHRSAAAWTVIPTGARLGGRIIR